MISEGIDFESTIDQLKEYKTLREELDRQYRSAMNLRIPKAPHIYQIDVINGDDFIEELLETMAVTFVKYNFFTVTSYPIKCLNEYILMCESSK